MKTTKHFNDVSTGARGQGAVPFSPGFFFGRTLEVLGDQRCKSGLHTRPRTPVIYRRHNLTPTLSPRCRHKETKAPRADAWGLLTSVWRKTCPGDIPRTAPAPAPASTGRRRLPPPTSPEGTLSRVMARVRALDGWMLEHRTLLVLTACPGCPANAPRRGGSLAVGRKGRRTPYCSSGRSPVGNPAAEQGAPVRAGESKWRRWVGPGNTPPQGVPGTQASRRPGHDVSISGLFASCQPLRHGLRHHRLV